jgi:hypothetical protein
MPSRKPKGTTTPEPIAGQFAASGSDLPTGNTAALAEVVSRQYEWLSKMR